MRKNIKHILSAMTAAAVCTVNLSFFTASSGMMIDHDSNGTENGYYYEFHGSGKNGDAEMSLETGCNFKCSWDNNENFTAARGLKFASPVEYSKLGSVMCRYYRSIDVSAFTNDKGYARFGIRVRNSNGDTFTIMETDTGADSASSIKSDKTYKKIGEFDSYEIMNDYNIFGPSDGERYEIPYDIYSHDDMDNLSVFCVRKKPIDINNDINDYRRISISDKLDAIAELGYDIGKVTDITFFLDASYTKGEAIIFTEDISIENMPETAPDEYDESDPVIVREYYEGVRDDNYYYISNRQKGQMEVVSPSLFKAEWDSTENNYDNPPLFERGKIYEKGQDYKALAESSIEYAIKSDAKGEYSVNTYALLNGPSTDEYNYETEVFIVDGCQEWAVSEYAENTGTLKVDGEVYDVYYYLYGIEGSGKPTHISKYYFVNRNAEKNIKDGTLSVKHDMKPFIEHIHESDERLGTPEKLVVQLNGGVSSGSAELVKNNVVLPEYIKDEKAYEKELRKIKLDNSSQTKTIDGITYKALGEKAVMEGYAGEKINVSWDASSKGDWRYVNNDGQHLFRIGKEFSTLSWNDLSKPWSGVNDIIGNVSAPDEHVMIDYNVDLGKLSDETEDSNYVLGGIIFCPDSEIREITIDTLSKSHSYYVIVADSMIREPGTEIANVTATFRDPVKLGAIETNGVKYDVTVYDPSNFSGDMSYVILTRQEPMKALTAESAEGHKRYAGSIDAEDIVSKLKKLDLDIDKIGSAYFMLDTFGNTGSAVINSVDVHNVKAEKAEYTADDLTKLSDFLHGKKVDIAEGTDYDLNDDGVWDVYDLCIMRKKLNK